MDKLFEMPYGKNLLTFTLPGCFQTEIISPKITLPATEPQLEVRKALLDPLATKEITAYSTGKTAAVVINDKTRPVPNHYLLPPLLQLLHTLGYPARAINLFIASGDHPIMESSEFKKIIPKEIIEDYSIICHDAKDESNLAYIGKTSRGTPIWMNKQFMEANLKILVGSIAPHQFQGYSGGAKSAAIGLAGTKTINHNHAMMKDKKARIGIYDINPARQDIEEIGRIIGVDFALNTILNHDKEIVHVLFGHPEDVMKSGIQRANEIYQVPTSVFDLIIASAGGYPKDINLYQSQKGLAHARLVTKKHGTIILAAECSEGSGNDEYENWVKQKTSQNKVLEDFILEGFRIGPHKAYQIARDVIDIDFHLYSSMEYAFVHSLLIHPVEVLQDTINQCIKNLPSRARIGVLPHAASTIPILKTT